MDFDNPAYDPDTIVEGDDDADEQTPLLGTVDDTWVVSNTMPSWANSGVPEGVTSGDLADSQQTEALLARWEKERGEIQGDFEFASTTKGELWLRWGRRWLLLTNKNKPGQFLAPSTLKRYGTDVTKALGVYGGSSLHPQAVAALGTVNQELGEVAGGDINLENIDRAVSALSEAQETALKTINDEPLDTSDLTRSELYQEYRELLGLRKAMTTQRGNLADNLAKLSELDKNLDLEKRKLGETDDEEEKQEIRIRIKVLNDERASRLELAATNREELRSQISRARETIRRILHEDKTLAERIRTLFREQGVTIASILTAIGMTISTIVLAITGGGGGGATPTPPKPSGEGGLKEWIKKTLKSLGRVLANLAGKAAAALPGIIGSIVSWLLSTLGKAAGWLAENTWALVVAVGGLLFVAAREWLRH